MNTKPQSQLFEEAFLPVQENTGTPYHCKQRNLDALLSLSESKRGPCVSAEQATKEILDHNAPSKVPASFEAAAIARLTEAMRYAFELPGGPDLAIKAFHDLDSVFFRGVLRRNVILQWTDNEDFKKGGITNECWGRTTSPKPGQCVISLNANVILLKPGWQPFKQMFCTLLHEMVHAHEHIRVKRKEINFGDPHGKHFGTRIHAINTRAYGLFGLNTVVPSEYYATFDIKGLYKLQENVPSWFDKDTEE